MVASAASSGDFALMTCEALGGFKIISLQSNEYVSHHLVAAKLRTFSFDNQIASETTVVKTHARGFVTLFS